MKSWDSRDVLSVFKLRKRYNKQTVSSEQKHCITMEKKYQNKCPNKRAKMVLYRSPDYQINWPFSPGVEVQNRCPR